MFSCVFTGRLGQQAEVRDVGESKVLKLRVAVPGRKGSEEVTTWVNVDYWNRGAEKLATFLEKGREITIRGELTTREYTANGQTKTSLDVRADNIQLVGGKSDNAHAKSHVSNTSENDGDKDDSIAF